MKSYSDNWLDEEVKEFVQKTIVGMLLASFIFSPVASALAQSTDAGASTGSNDASAGDNAVVEPSVPDNSVISPSEDAASPASGPEATQGQDAAVSASPSPSPSPSPTPTPTPPPAPPAAPPPPPSSGGDNIAPPTADVFANSFNKDQLKIDQNTGALDTSYPIVIPPGRNGLQPDVNLTYNSQNNQQGSIVGEGWAINIPYIAHLNKTGTDHFYGTSTQYFISSLDGELATTTVSSSYIARTENGAFNKYTFANNQWTITDKDGKQFVFGSSTQSQQSDPNNSADVYKWMLEKFTDTNGNYVSYNYRKDAGQIYPSSTTYTANGTSTGIFEVDFSLATSTDNATSSAAGFPVKSNYRVSEIDAKVNGTWVRKYVLGYTTGDNSSTALLGSIAESGETSSGTVVSLPSSTFSYGRSVSGWTVSSTWASPQNFSNTGPDYGAQLADVTGDGLTDILYGYYDFNTHILTDHAWVNNGHGWTASSTWYPVWEFADKVGTAVRDSGARIADVNGDGLADSLIKVNLGSADSETNNGHGWIQNLSWAPPVIFADSDGDQGARIADINGDGLPDIVTAYSPNDGSSSTYDAWLDNGNGWTESTSTWNPPTLFTVKNFSAVSNDPGARVADVNGDGLEDIIYGYSGTYDAWISNGHGWTEDGTWNPPVSFSVAGLDSGARVVDVNGDGLPDIVSGYFDGATSTYDAWINNGHGWTESTSTWNPPVIFSNSGTFDPGTRIVDVNGDGLPDIISSSTAYINNGRVRVDLLTGITYPAGGSSTVAYKSATQITDGSGNILNTEPYPVYVVSQMTTNDGSSNIASSSYQYSGGSYYYNSSTMPFDRQFAGFSVVTSTDASNNKTVSYFHTGSGTDSAHGEYNDNFWKIGKPYRIENYDSTGNLYKVTVNKWDSTSLGGNASFVELAQTTHMDYDALATHKDSAEAYTYDNTNGNQTQKIQYGQVVANTDGSFNDTSTDEYVTNITYATSTTTGVLGKPSDLIVLNQSSTKIKEAQYYYDGLSLGNVSTGNLTKQQDWKTSSTYITTAQDTYNGYGLRTVYLDPRNSTTTYAYDANNLYPATTTNALGQTTGYQYDYSTGKPTQTTDPNGNVAQSSYDGLGRTLAALQPDPNNSSTLATSTVYAYTDSANAVSVHETDYLTATTTVDTYSYYDGLNRPVQTRKSSENANTYKVTDRAYNNVGRIQSDSLPYFASGSTKSAATSTAALFTNYTYDPLQRALTASNAVGTTTVSYVNWKTVTVDARGKEKDVYDDAYGNLVQVDEHNGSSTYSTYYAYYGLKDLATSTDALGNVRGFTYDGLGRRLTAQDLHAATDTTYGTWTYTYDDASNPTQTIDPKNQSTTYTYDVLNRPTSENFTSQPQLTYTYDTCTQGVGRLCIASSSDAIVSSTYNSLGQLTQEVRTIGSSTYSTAYTYDRQGNQLTITNPDNSQVQYTYNTAGLVETVAQKPNGGSSANVVTDFDYSPTDQPTVINYANGVVVTNTYDPTKLYRLTQKVGALPAGGSGQNVSYTYDPMGNITQLVDAGNSGAGRTVNYAYDDLSRLLNASTTNVSTTPGYNQVFTYDALGNILSGPLGTYTYAGSAGSNYADPDAVTSISTSTATGGGPFTIGFDASSTNISTGFNSGTVTKSWTHTVTGTSTILILTADILQDASGTGTVASATWKGVAFTKLQGALSGTMDSEIWYLAPTSTGSGTLAVTVSGATDAIKLGATSLTGVSTSSPIDATSTATGTSGNPSSSITTLTSSDLVIDTLSRFSTTTASTNRTPLYNDTSFFSSGGGTVTSTPAFVRGGMTSTSTSVTLSGTVASSDLMVVGITENGTTMPANAVTDNKGNTYTKAAEAVNGTSGDHAVIYYAKNIIGGSSFIVSLTSTVAGSIAVQEYSGVATSSPFDQASTSTGSSGNPTSGNVTTNTDHELYFGLAWNGSNGASWTAGSGYTLREQETNDATAERIASEDKTVNTATTTAATFTTTSDFYSASIATFKPLVTATSSGGASTGTLAAASYQITTSTGTFSDTYTGSSTQNWSMVMAALKPGGGSGSATSTTSFTYDNNGNLVSSGNATDTWNYKNQLTQWTNGTATSSYAYDYLGNRVKLVEGGVATVFPTKYYNAIVGGATSTEHIFADGMLIATSENTSTTTSSGGGSATSTIALDATSTSITTGFNAGPVTKTWTHTISSTSTLLVLTADIWQDTGGTGSVSSATWKGLPFIKVKTSTSVNMESELWYLVPTSSGSGTVSITVTGATDAIKLGAASFTGSATSSVLDASSTATGTTGNPSITITTASSSDVVVATLSRFSTTNATTNQKVLYNDHAASTLAAGSYQVTTSSGSFSDTYTGSAAQDWAMVAASFRPGTTGSGGGTTTSTVSSTIRYILDDHLGGIGVVTDASGTVVETLDYYPYGQARLDIKTGTYGGEKRKYIGQEYDTGSGFDYLNSRYYDGNRGQFTSEDPVFLGIPIQQSLSDPQSLNSYSYSDDNPIVKSDPTGRDYVDSSGAWTFPTEFGSFGPAVDVLTDLNGNNSDPYVMLGVAYTAIPGPSGQVTAVSGNPSAGLNGSVSFTPQHVALQFAGLLNSNGKLQGSILPGIGGPRGAGLSTRSFGVTLGLTLRVSQWAALVADIAGRFKEETTISTVRNKCLCSTQLSLSNQQNGSAARGGGSSGGGGGFSGQDPAGTYTFNNGKNAYGQSYNQVFPH